MSNALSFLIASVAFVTCNDSIQRAEAINAPLLRIIAAKSSTKDILQKAISDLVEVTEPAAFWTKIANDKSYTEIHRRLAIYQLVHRHLGREMPISELNKILDHPSWLPREKVRKVDTVIGKIPVKATLQDSILCVDIFTNTPARFVLYFRVAGKSGFESFVSQLDTKVGDEQPACRILEFGLSPSLPSQFRKK